MAVDPKVLGSYPNCPQCGSDDTISKLATADLKARGKIPVDMPTQTKAEVIPLEQAQLAGVTVACLMLRYDVCAGCGTERVIRAEVIQAPVVGQPQGGFGRLPPGSGRG